MGLGFFTVSLRWWKARPIAGERALVLAEPAWPLMVLSVLMLGLGYFLVKTAEATTREMLENIPQLTLVRQSAIRILVWRQRIGGVLLMIAALIPLSLWMESLRR